MQIPLPPYAIVVGLANAGLVLEKAWPAMNDRFGHGRSMVSSVLVPHYGSWRSRMMDMCLNLDRSDGILIEMVVEEREPGIAVVVVAID